MLFKILIKPTIKQYAISDDEETEFARAYPTGEVPLDDILAVMQIVDDNTPENYFAALKLDWQKPRRKTLQKQLNVKQSQRKSVRWMENKSRSASISEISDTTILQVITAVASSRYARKQQKGLGHYILE